MEFKSSNYWHGKLSNIILKKDNFRCVFCHSTNDLLIDHIVPVKKGGSNSLNNQRTLCRSCHSKISNTKAEEKLSYSGKYLRKWKIKHKNYFTNYLRQWRKKHPGYFTKYTTKEKWQLYKNA